MFHKRKIIIVGKCVLALHSSVIIVQTSKNAIYVPGLIQVKTLISSMPTPSVNVRISFRPLIPEGSVIDVTEYGSCQHKQPTVTP